MTEEVAKARNVAQFRKTREVGGHWLVDVQCSHLLKAHDRRSGELLRDRANTESRFGGNWPTATRIGDAEVGRKELLATATDYNRKSRSLR
jgi:hypothetical protein